jgi:hypothetical protein
MAKVKKVSDSYTAYAKGGAKLKKGANGLMSTTTPAMRQSRTRVAAERAEAPMRRRARAAAAMASAPMMKKGGSFRDLNKDGKITKADILKGRGVIKNGGKMKKSRGGATLSPSKSSVSKGLGSSKRLKSGGTLSPSKNAVSKRLASAHTRVAKKGASMKKCRGGCY